CESAPCVTACPTSAMVKRPDGIVDFDKSVCIGCKACMAACPYDAIFINPDDHSAEKCNFCAHRLEVGLEPACVTVCPTEAIIVGDLHDPASKVARMVGREALEVRRPEKGTRPGVFYKGAHQATLDPLAARRPDGGLFAWASQGLAGARASHRGRRTSSAEALLAYDVPHGVPWDWRVSAYTWTKSVAAGAVLVPLVLAVAGRAAWGGSFARWAAPAVALFFLALTAGLLIWDLEHPGRFWMILTRHQWRSWLVRGGVILGAYGAAVVLYLVGGLAGSVGVQQVLAGFSIPLAAATAGYTAYLFAQAKGRDLWQSPLLAPHLVVQAVMAGAAAMLPLALWLGPSRTVVGVEALLCAAAAAHLACVLGEITLTHPTAHARAAVDDMTRGRFAGWFWAGVVGAAVAVAAPWVGAAATPLGLLGLLAHEHAYVQAGQSVPLA
ncbi:MAG: 4Fe-4S dicluster domain-containing protein, partial [Acidimicrobiales bacterium]